MDPTERIERQEIYCHNCGRYVQFNVNMAMNGRYVLNCPNCGHEHCRVVEDGRITEERWASRNYPTIVISSRAIQVSYTSSAAVINSISSTGGNFIINSWSNATSSTTSW